MIRPRWYALYSHEVVHANTALWPGMGVCAGLYETRCVLFKYADLRFVCLLCMPVLYVCLVCLPCMSVFHVCLVCPRITNRFKFKRVCF